MKPIVILFICMCLSLMAQAQRTSPIGKWKTVDDATGKVKSVVEVYERGGKLFGKVLQLIEPDKPDPVCDKCDKTDPRHMKKVIGLEVIRNMVCDGSEWEDGDILDPENGKVYRCKLWVENGKLQVRGYIAFLYRTQTWLPAD
jgi:uncharacterized protein (DUF2147 family)